MSYAIAFTKEGTTLTFWLNRFSWGGFIWSLVRTSSTDTSSDQRWNQPALRFATAEEGQAFIASELAGNPAARVSQVSD